MTAFASEDVHVILSTPLIIGFLAIEPGRSGLWLTPSSLRLFSASVLL